MSVNELPAPPISADVDLRSFPYTPIFRARLFGSEFHAHANDAEWRAGVTLWLKSWEQVPAGSLPEDDVALCRLAELGRDLNAWKNVREYALHQWTKCSDGRLYHPVVAEGVNEAWALKLSFRQKMASARAAKQSKKRSMIEPMSASLSEPVIDPITDSITDSITDPITEPVIDPVISSMTRLNLTKLNKEERKKLESSETPTPAPEADIPRPAAKIYAFEGQLVRVTQRDFDVWKTSYFNVKDMRASLTVIDAKFVDLGVPRGQAFGKASAWLMAEHERNTSATNGRGGDPLPPGVAYISDEGRTVLTLEEIERREEAQWRRRLTKYRADPSFWVGDWGPPPTDERCFLAIDPSLSAKTKHLLVEFGFSK